MIRNVERAVHLQLRVPFPEIHAAAAELNNPGFEHAATWRSLVLGHGRISDAGIALCLDHQVSKDENGKPLPSITRKVYKLATRIRVAKKREMLDAWAIELRRIIGKPAETELRLVA